MSNPSRKKGTAGENFFLHRLRRLFYPDVPLPTTLDEEQRHPLQRLDIGHGDYTGVPWLHEAKNTRKPLFQQWARVATRKAANDWVLLWKGDLRRYDPGQGPLVVMPYDKYVELVTRAREGDQS